MKRKDGAEENRDLIHRKRSPSRAWNVARSPRVGIPVRGEGKHGGGKCDGCGWLEIEAPVNRYDVWRACCCDPDKPMMGARRVVATTPAGLERGPVGIRTPVWCRGKTTPQSLRDSSPCTGKLKRNELKNRRGADDTATAE